MHQLIEVIYYTYIKMDEVELNSVFNSCIDSLESCINTINKYSDDKIKQTEYLRDVIAKNYCAIDLEYERTVEALKKAEEHISNEDIDPTTNVMKLYESYLEKEKTRDCLTHPVWYRIAKNEANNSLQVVEPMENVEHEEYEKLDDSLMCSQKTSQTLDPITKVPIKRPCKSKICGHLYDYETISQHVQRKRTKGASCPYMGCSALVRMSDICFETEA